MPLVNKMNNSQKKYLNFIKKRFLWFFNFVRCLNSFNFNFFFKKKKKKNVISKTKQKIHFFYITFMTDIYHNVQIFKLIWKQQT